MVSVKLIAKGANLRHCPEDYESKCEKCGDWLKHWEKYTYKNIENCCFCGDKKSVGARVMAENDKKEWIVPTCYICSEKVGVSETKYDVYAVAMEHFG